MEDGKIRKSYDRTLNFARFRTLANGDAWFPNGTVGAQNFYTALGVTRKNVNFDLATATTDIIAKCEEVIANFQTQATEGQEIQRVVAILSWLFSALIAHPKVTAAYNLFAVMAPQQISRDRAGGMGLYRRFTFSNIEFIEVTQSGDGTASG